MSSPTTAFRMGLPLMGISGSLLFNQKKGGADQLPRPFARPWIGGCHARCNTLKNLPRDSHGLSADGAQPGSREPQRHQGTASHRLDQLD